MKKFINRIPARLVPVLFFGLLAIACKKEMEDLEPMRMFTPAGTIAAVSGEKQVRLIWNRSLYTTAGSGVTYTVEVAADTLFETPVVLSVQTDTSGVVLTDEQLQTRQIYFARIKANALDDRPESKWVTSNSFSIRGEQIFQAMFDNDVIENAVILKWRESPGLSRIVMTAEGGASTEVMLTDEDRAARQITIGDLTPGTAYTAEIFAGSQYRGAVQFTTKAATSTGNVINLARITGRPTVLADTIPDIPAGSTVLLRRGQTYNISSTVNLGKAITIMSENSFNPEMATLFFTSNFNFEEGSAIDSIVFKNLRLRGEDYSSNYVINANRTATVGKLVFEGCQVDTFRGMVRLQSSNPIHITDFQVKNSIISSISNYGIVNVDNVNSRIDNILIQNSTVYKVEKVITSRQNSNAVIIENSTFNEAPWGGNYLVDYSQSATNTVSQGVKIINSIFGIGLLKGEDTAVRGVRVNAGSLVESTGSYTTSDYSVTSHEIPGLTPYSGSSTDLFENPQEGNFRIKDQNFAGRNTAGDPRWRL